MGRDGLFDDLAEMAKPKDAASGGRPRLREPERRQIELRSIDLDGTIGADHPARTIWAYVERLDLRVLEDRVRAREGRPGHPPISPRLLVALWLYATSQGVGSARALARLCARDDAYRWLCGGVSVNHHTLAEFRIGQEALLDALLVETVAALTAAGVVDPDTLAQDGVRVRAGAGASSFRRVPTLHKALKRAERAVRRLKRELDDDPDASNRRIAAARERAAADRVARVERALKEQAKLAEETRRRGERDKKKRAKSREPRVSTTDPEARVMKMADGGFRPAYNVQIASDPEAQIVVALDVETSGSDRGLMRPMLESIRRCYDRLPRRHLADAAFGKKDDIEWAAESGVLVHCPPLKNRHGPDPFAPRADDGPGVAAWRRRMTSPAGKARYKRRALCECIHARFRNWNLRQFTVRGRQKVRAVALRFALANNVLATRRLCPAGF
ncbi:MAG TPA: IS1182 family transposase [Solirubrobacter sp.]|nr:IS1182 family transposase [Solirubrobacter sp.]